ncbi:retrovirus-related Pol polyprotein from transposon opus [Trichonephila clavipes]|nr:retrovirus-related Pol polyprotein from transposon opus [Trichonephila clavipes]
MANSRMTFCKVCGFKEYHHISRLFYLHPQSLWINWLSSLIRFLRLLVHPRLSVLAKTVPPPSQSSSCNAQPTMDSLARQIQELSLQVAELTRERNSSRHQRYSSDRRRSHSRSRSVNRGSGICYYHRRYKEQARKCVSPLCICAKNDNPLISKSASHGTVHHIITTGPPVTARPRRLHPKLYDAVKVEFEFLLAQGIIRPSKSPWSSPLHVVPKSDSTVRPVGDYRQLNSVTEFDSYPMPYLNDLLMHYMARRRYFPK